MHDYQQGQRFQWIQPEPGMNGIVVNQELYRGGPEVCAIEVVMEPGLHRNIPHFAVLGVDGRLLRKYPAHFVFCAATFNEVDDQ